MLGYYCSACDAVQVPTHGDYCDECIETILHYLAIEEERRLLAQLEEEMYYQAQFDLLD